MRIPQYKATARHFLAQEIQEVHARDKSSSTKDSIAFSNTA